MSMNLEQTEKYDSVFLKIIYIQDNFVAIPDQHT